LVFNFLKKRISFRKIFLKIKILNKLLKKKVQLFKKKAKFFIKNLAFSLFQITNWGKKENFFSKSLIFAMTLDLLFKKWRRPFSDLYSIWSTHEKYFLSKLKMT